MVKGPDEMLKMHAEMTQATHAMMLKSLEGFRRLADVNLQAARESLDTSAEQISALLAAKDIGTVTQLVSSFAQPSTEKFTAYAQAVAAVARDTQSEFAAMVQQHISRSNAQLATAIEQLARNAPSGSEGAAAFMQQAMAATTSSYEQLNEQMRRLMEVGAQATAKTAARTR